MATTKYLLCVVFAGLMVLGFALPGVHAALVSHWTFDEGSGSIAADSVGTWDGTVYGATWTTGISGNALSFDGLNDYVGTGDLDIAPAATISAWINTAGYALDRGYGVIVGKEDSAVELLVHDTNLRMNGEFGGNNYIVVETSAYPILFDVWQHVVGTYDGASLKLYVDGVLKAITVWAGGIETNNVDLWIGARNRAPGIFFFWGAIDEVQIYDNALTAAEVKVLYRFGTVSPVDAIVELLGETDKIMALLDKDHDGDLTDETVGDVTQAQLAAAIADAIGDDNARDDATYATPADVDAAIADDNARDNAAYSSNRHVHDKGSGGRMTSGPIEP